MKPPVLDMDFRKVEESLMADLAAGDNIYSAAAKLPRRHPARFALLYGMGPKKLLDLAEQFSKPPSVTERALTLECEIQCFENWQENETVAAVTKHRAENGAIAYAAMEEAMTLPLTVPLPTTVNAGPAWADRRWANRKYHSLKHWDGTETGHIYPAKNFLIQAQNAAETDLHLAVSEGLLTGLGEGVASNAAPGFDVPVTLDTVRAALERIKNLPHYPEEGILRD